VTTDRQLGSSSAVREYHASLYVPHNLTLLVVGVSCPLDALLHTLNTVVEPSILAHPPARTEGWKRPFLETTTGEGVKWPKGDRVEVVEFMESDESVGEVQVAFGDGVARTNWVDCLAIDGAPFRLAAGSFRSGRPADDVFCASALCAVLTTYLTDSPIAPLNKAFVEIPAPFCTAIDLYTATRHPVNEMTLYISDVPVEHLDAISGLVRAELRRIADDGIDMDRMAMVLRRERRQVMHSLEGRPESMVEQSAIGGASARHRSRLHESSLTCARLPRLRPPVRR
jgi:Zn-dependent M16 (insulinase) family peptidase